MIERIRLEKFIDFILDNLINYYDGENFYQINYYEGFNKYICHKLIDKYELINNGIEFNLDINEFIKFAIMKFNFYPKISLFNIMFCFIIKLNNKYYVSCYSKDLNFVKKNFQNQLKYSINEIIIKEIIE